MGGLHSRLISIHALHEESDTCSKRSSDDIKISIHALHEESDGRASASREREEISIHALHEESDIADRHELVH